MTARQIELARHALGLSASCLRSHRNAFVTGPDAADFADWEAMVEAGFATRGPRELALRGDRVFRLTRAGAEHALLPGDVLDPEDWPDEPAPGFKEAIEVAMGVVELP